MWTTRIAPLCSSGFVTNKIVLDRVTDQKPSLLFVVLFANWHCYIVLPSHLLLDSSHSLASFSSDYFVRTKAGSVPLPSLHLISLFTSSTDFRCLFHCRSAAVNVMKESELSFSDYVKCLWININ